MWGWISSENSESLPSSLAYVQCLLPRKTLKSTILAVQCTDQTGTRRDIAEKWEINDVEYVCDIKRGIPIPELTDEFVEVKPRGMKCFATFE